MASLLFQKSLTQLGGSCTKRSCSSFTSVIQKEQLSAFANWKSTFARQTSSPSRPGCQCLNSDPKQTYHRCRDTRQKRRARKWSNKQPHWQRSTPTQPEMDRRERPKCAFGETMPLSCLKLHKMHFKHWRWRATKTLNVTSISPAITGKTMINNVLSMDKEDVATLKMRDSVLNLMRKVPKRHERFVWRIKKAQTFNNAICFYYFENRINTYLN